MKSTTTAAEMDRRAGTRNEEKKPIRDKEGDMPVHLSPGGGAEIDRRAGTRNAAGAIHTPEIPGQGSDSTGRYSDTAAMLNTAETATSLNHTTDTVSQLHSKPRRIQSYWSQRILRTMITLMLFMASSLKVEGSSDWQGSAFKTQSFDCNTPAMINKLHLPDIGFILEKKLPEKLAAAQPAWILRDEYVQELSGVVCSATISTSGSRRSSSRTSSRSSAGSCSTGW